MDKRLNMDELHPVTLATIHSNLATSIQLNSSWPPTLTFTNTLSNTHTNRHTNSHTHTQTQTLKQTHTDREADNLNIDTHTHSLKPIRTQPLIFREELNRLR